jgi:hypothetical protein
MHEWICICGDVDSEQNIKKTIRIFLWFGKKNNLLCVNGYTYMQQHWWWARHEKNKHNIFVVHEFYWLFELPTNINWDYNLIKDISWNVSTPLVLIPPIIPLWNKKLENYVKFSFNFCRGCGESFWKDLEWGYF